MRSDTKVNQNPPVEVKPCLGELLGIFFVLFEFEDSADRLNVSFCSPKQVYHGLPVRD